MQKTPIIPKRTLLEIRTARTGEETPESMVQFLASFINFRKRILYFYKKPLPLSLEITVYDSMIHFFVSIPTEYREFLESQLTAQYPKALMVKTPDYLPHMIASPRAAAGQLKLAHGYLFPLRTYKDFTDVDPLSSLVGILSKTKKENAVCIQFLLKPVSRHWQARGLHVVQNKKADSEGHAVKYPF